MPRTSRTPDERTPDEIFRRLLESLPAKDMDAVADLWAPEGTAEFDTIVVEFTAHGRTVRTGEPYRLDYITVVTARDGLITRYRDYWSPPAAAAAAGDLPNLLDSLRPEATR
ncbi:hypothetical protein GCM10017557_58240 [Streptomyces aurantiacus]|uniref:SnoaL-like domain-containing protein n=2 Tax=Streptomyces aurantiacus TaxID=47760 RepID=A0A7G1PD02_9ACTN|nr:hypothetical protein GCM10017557_58240 [Streptomyces aurantiacus]